MLRIIKSQKGSALIFAVLVMVSMLGFAALAIDTGMILTADHQLQNAVDAAALAGASGLLINQSVATNRAVAISSLNDCMNRAVVINAANVSYPAATRILVQANRQVPLFVAPILGVNTSAVTAVASALLEPLSETRKLKPWAVPFLNWNIGEQVLLKAGDNDDAPGTNPSFHYAIDYPPVNKGTPIPGGNAYRDFIMNSYDGTVTIGDIIQVEPGNKVGPTRQGVDYLMSQDPGAFWDTQQGAVLGSNYPGFSSPRIIKIPFYDPNSPPGNGRSTITVTGLGSFFLEGMSGKDLIGRFMKITTEGTNKGGPGAGLLYQVKLIQ